MQLFCICVYLYMFVCVDVYMYTAHVYKAPAAIPAPQKPTPQPAQPCVPAPHTAVLSQALRAPPLPQAGCSVSQAVPIFITSLAPAVKPPPLPHTDTTSRTQNHTSPFTPTPPRHPAPTLTPLEQFEPLYPSQSQVQAYQPLTYPSTVCVGLRFFYYSWYLFFLRCFLYPILLNSSCCVLRVLFILSLLGLC